MNKENIKVTYALLIVRILIFRILKCNVWELEQSLIKRASSKENVLKDLVGALSVSKCFRLFKAASFSCIKLSSGLTIMLPQLKKKKKQHTDQVFTADSDFPALLAIEGEQSMSHSREQSPNVNSEQNFSPKKYFFLPVNKSIEIESSSRKGPWKDLLSNLNVFTIHTLLYMSCHYQVQTLFQ